MCATSPLSRPACPVASTATPELPRARGGITLHYMTTSRALPREAWCAQHHQDRSECEPWDRHGHTMRFREDDWRTSEATAAAENSDITTSLTEVMTVTLGGYIRCHRCALNADPVPLEYGDLQGRPLREWVADAVIRVQRQHPRHEPVTIGAEPSGPPAVALAAPFKAAQ